MDELETKLAQLKQRAERATASRARAIATQEAARAKLTEAVRELKQSFGLSSMAEAQELYEELSRQAELKLSEVQQLLDRVENG